MIKAIRELQELTRSANLLVDNHGDMTAQSVYNEHRMLIAEFEVAKRKATSAIRGGSEDAQELLDATVECMRAINQAEDGLELKHNRISTNL